MMVEDVAADTLRRLRQMEGCGYPNDRDGEHDHAVCEVAKANMAVIREETERGSQPVAVLEVLAERNGGSLTDDVVAWLRELNTYNAEHRYLTCECPSRGVDHERRRADLLSRKRAILARIEEANP